MKPSKPITAIDLQIYSVLFNKPFASKSSFGEVWSTYSQIGSFTFGAIMAIDMQGSVSISSDDCGFDVAVKKRN